MKKSSTVISVIAILVSITSIFFSAMLHSEHERSLSLERQNNEVVTHADVSLKYPVDANYVSSPIKYEDTVQETTKTFSIPVEKGQIAIVGGYEVDGISGGVYLVLGPGDHTIAISNGFYVIVFKDDAQNEFNFRLNQALEYGWLDGSDEEIK